MPNHLNNIYAAHQIHNLDFNCKVVAVARYADEVKNLAELGVIAFNMYAEAGTELAQYEIMEGVKYCSLDGEMPTYVVVQLSSFRTELPNEHRFLHTKILPGDTGGDFLVHRV